jgi:hypothetical protein
MNPVAEPAPSWQLAELLAAVRVPPPPSSLLVSPAGFAEAQDLFDTTTEAVATRPASAEQWSSFLAHVAATGEAASRARESLEIARRARVVAAREYAASLPASYIEQVGRHLNDLDSASGDVAIAHIADLGDRAHREAIARLVELETTAARVERLSEDLVATDRHALRSRVERAIRSVDPRALLDVETEAAGLLQARRTQRAIDVALAGEILEALHDGSTLSDDAVLAALADVRDRRLDAVLERIRPSRIPSREPSEPAQQTSSSPPSTRPQWLALFGPPLERLSQVLDLTDVRVAVGSFVARNRITNERFQRPRDQASPGVDRITALTAASDPTQAIVLATQFLVSRDPTLQSTGAFFLLTWRAVEEAQRDSLLGVVEHALDIVRLAATSNPAHAGWASVGLALLGFEPSNRDSPSALAPRVHDVLDKLANGDLAQAWGSMLAASGRDTLVAERLAFPDIRPFASLAGRALYDAAANQNEPRPYVLEDVARGLMTAFADGDRGTAAELLAELVGLDGAASAADAIRRVGRGARPVRDGDDGPEWAAHTVDRLRDIQRRPAPQNATVFVMVPKSVASHGGFYAPDGDIEALDIALHVSNTRASASATRSAAAFVELVVLAGRNPKLIATDVVIQVGTLRQDDIFVVPARLPVREEVDLTSSPWALQYQVRWCDSTSGKVFTEDRGMNLPITRSPAEPVRNYTHDDGRPIVLGEGQLKLSSLSVVKALRAVRLGLQQGSLATLLTGRRRRGKTSILETIKQDVDVRKTFVVVADIREDLPFRSYRETLGHLGGLLDRVPQKLGVSVGLLAPRLQAVTAGSSEIQQWLEDLTDAVPGPTKVLLLIDEFQKWVSALDAESVTRVLGLFRALANRPTGARVSFSMILSGLTNLDTLVARNADFKNIFQSQRLLHFNQRETEALVRSNDSIEFDTRAIAAVTRLSGGNPFLVNLLGSMIASELRELGRAYCLPEDVERVVGTELRDDQSRVRSFVQYLLRKGEENHAAEVEELPTLVALAYAVREHRGTHRHASIERVMEELRRAEVKVEESVLREQLSVCVQNELVVPDGNRYGFATEWLERWLRVMHATPLPIVSARDPELVLNRYRIQRPLGSGGQAQVYEADDKRLQQKVVLKVYARTGGGTTAVAQSEVEALRRIEHSGVVRILDYGPDEQKGDVVVLDRVDGQNLRWYLREQPASAGRLLGPNGDVRVQVAFVTRAAQALDECHRAGVVHKDIKPENIVVTEIAGNFQPVLIDFGIAHVGLAEDELQTSGAYTPGYVAPERYAGERRRAASDVYSLGVVAYELLSGLSPFPTGPSEAPMAQLEGQFVALSERRPDVPEKLSTLVGAMLARDPSLRPEAGALVQQLAFALEPAGWREVAAEADRSYNDAAAGAAVEQYAKALFLASRDERLTLPFEPVLVRLLDALAVEPHSAVTLLPRIAHTVADVACNGPSCDAETGGRALRLLIDRARMLGAPDDQSKGAVDRVVQVVLQMVLDHPPRRAAIAAVEALLGALTEPSVVARAADVFLAGAKLVAADLLAPHVVGAACVAAARFARIANGDLPSAQTWLRRAALFGGEKLSGYLPELEEVDRQAKKTVTPTALPPDAFKQAGHVVGKDEYGHLHVERIQRWANRVMELFRWVESVRRVRKDGGIPAHSTRLLNVSNLSQHLAAAKDVEAVRVIPAALDGSYSIPSGIALRMNIILPKGTTEVQRAAAMAALRAEKTLFADDED